MPQYSRRSVAIVGLGYVGLPLALLSRRKGHDVVGLDIDVAKIAALENGTLPYHDPRLQAALTTTGLPVSTDMARAAEADIVIVCVPTPVRDDHSPNLGPLEGACASIAPHLRTDSLIVIESTVNPGICENVVIPVLEKASGKKAGVDFHISHCPERINPGDDRWNVENISRVAGSLTPEGLELTLSFYRSIIDAPITPMQTLKEAEAVKIVENTFRDINIAFVNELARSFDVLGIDVVNVLNGAATKPFAFMPHYPSCGVGGHCIPVDPYYLIAEGRRNGFEHEFLSLARKINNTMPTFTVELLERELTRAGKTIEGSRIAVLGLAYKADIDDVRESPSYAIIREITGRGATAAVFDPLVPHESLSADLASTLQGSDAAVIATAHSHFRNLTPEDFLNEGVAIVIDGKNCLDKPRFTSAGIAYKGIGR